MKYERDCFFPNRGGRQCAMVGCRLFFLVSFFVILHQTTEAQTVALPTAYAHNDYRHKRPFYDAIKNGFTYMESDIYLCHNRLLVLHSFPYFKGHRTLESMYLKPLLQYITSRQHLPQTAMDTLVLMIDMKSDGERTFTALNELLEKYQHILSYSEDGKTVRRNLTIVLSGHRPLEMLREVQTRYFFVDENLHHVNKDEEFKDMYAIASCKYKQILKWKGKGPMPLVEKKRLCDLVSKAHQFGKKVRLWASPEKENVWTELLKCGVDLINTDKLEAYRLYALQNARSNIAVANYDLWLP
jgi:hypothetical protein